jgi:hypothetical protein
MFRKEFLLNRQKLTGHKTLHNEDIPNLHQNINRVRKSTEGGQWSIALPSGTGTA